MAKRKILVELQEEIDAKRTKMKKPRKPRKPMTPEQRAAAVERLAKARAARAPAKTTRRPEFFDTLSDDHPMSWNKLSDLIKEETLLVKSLKGLKDSNKWQERSKLAEAETYLEALKKYQRTGIMTHTHGGKNASQALRFKSVAMAYYKDGTPKRTLGVYYPDVGVWTQEMQNEQSPVKLEKKKVKRTIIKDKSPETNTIIDITQI